MIKKNFKTQRVLKTPRKFFVWFSDFLYFLIFRDYAKIGVSTQTCSNLKFPVTLGYESGETEIFSVDLDASTGFLFLGGTSTAKEIKVSEA